ncbi:sensor histidine kinase [Streptococcus macacae]|uniref:histidine kinase n=1 Tax=Streptococcus macacae NCTC 11558 TaxID=764298 RepID=G5JU98_9STRE|nr:HAMP domain-containing sensor histidine kinase [Streptococcus macacae]EHJ51732.1 ATPase/histidine kinase/DNA gyrase B/HSP90 domain protein [Streptococcus macacae NCTC 11558]SUN78461.1 histidine kinase [Streptococcus macacae NCTC 11558]
MSMILLFVLSLILAIAIIYLIRYHLAVKSLSQQIEEKIDDTSQRRLTLINQPQSLTELANKIESLFEQIEKTNLIALQEKKTLDMAISNIAHDIRTPLTIASGYTQQGLRKETVNAADLEKISENLTIVSKRLEALLEYRRLTEGTIQTEMQKVALSHLVTKSILLYYDMFQQVDIILDLQIEEEISFETDPDIFKRLFQNIISNVLKHGKEQAQLTLKQTDQEIVLQVKNIVKQPIQHLNQLTTRFYSENMSDTEESSGLGLYIIQHLVGILGGSLDLATNDNWFILTVTL